MKKICQEEDAELDWKMGRAEDDGTSFGKDNSIWHVVRCLMGILSEFYHVRLCCEVSSILLIFNLSGVTLLVDGLQIIHHIL